MAPAWLTTPPLEDLMGLWSSVSEPRCGRNFLLVEGTFFFNLFIEFVPVLLLFDGLVFWQQGV